MGHVAKITAKRGGGAAPAAEKKKSGDKIAALLAEWTGGKAEFFESGRYHGHNDYVITVSNDKPQPDFVKYGLQVQPANGGLDKNETLYFISADQANFDMKLAEAVSNKRRPEVQDKAAVVELVRRIQSELASRKQGQSLS